MPTRSWAGEAGGCCGVLPSAVAMPCTNQSPAITAEVQGPAFEASTLSGSCVWAGLQLWVRTMSASLPETACLE